MKKLLYGVVGLIAVAAAAIVVVPLFVDAGAIKERLTAEVEAATGRKLEINGDFDFAVLPTPRVVASDVRFANPPGASAPEMVTLDRLEVQVALLPLLGGAIQVETVRLIAPTIALETFADGGNNWTFGEAKAATGSAGSVRGGGTVRIDDLRIVNGRISYRDAASGREQTVTGLNATFAAESTAGPFHVAGEAVVGGLPLNFEVRAGRHNQAGIPLAVTVAIKDAGARLAFEGGATGADAAAMITGKLRASGDDLGQLLALVGRRAGEAPALPPALAQAFEIKSRLSASAAAIALDDIDVTLGEARGNGAFSLAFGTPTRIDATVNLASFDLDAATAGGGAGAAPAKAVESDKLPAELAALKLPEGIEGHLALSVDAVTYRGAVVQQVQLAARLSAGRLELERASALLPGSSDVTLAGAMMPGPDGPRFEGSVEAASDNLRGLLSWLGVDSAAVPGDRLHRFSVTSKFRLMPTVVQVYGIDLRLDTSRLTGAAAYALRRRPSFSADVSIDRLNLDAYLLDGGGKRAAVADGKRAEAPHGLRLALLNDFDTNLKAKVGSLTFNHTQFDGLAFDGSLIGGVLTLRQAAVRDAAGGRASFQGMARGFAAEPFVKLAVAAEADDLTRLVRAAGTAPPTFLAAFGPTGVHGQVEGTADKLGLDVTLAAAEGKARVKGEVSGARRQPHFDFDLDFKHPNLAKLAERFGIALGNLAGATGPVTVTGTASGTLETLKIDVIATLLGGTVKAKGDLLHAASAPTVDVEVAIDHPNLTALAKQLGVTLEPALGAEGPLTVGGHITGNLEALIVDLTAKAAGATLHAAGDLAEATTSPKYNLRVDGRHPSYVGLAAPFGLALKPGARGDGPVTVTGRVKGDVNAVNLDLEVKGAEATARLAGDVADLQADRRMDIRLDVVHPSYQRLAQVLDVARTGLRRDSPVSVNGRLTGNARALKLALDVGVVDAAINVAGNVSEIDTAPRLDIKFSAQHPSFVRLMQSVDAGIDPLAGAQDGPITMSGTVTGSLDNLTAALDAKAAGAQLRGSGRFAKNGPEIRYSAAFEAGHGNIVGLMRALGVDYRPGRRDLGGLALRGTLTGTGTALDVQELTGKFGPVDIGGTMRARWDGPRPQLTGRLSTNEIVLDALLPAAAGKPGAAPAGGAAAPGPASDRWSSEPIDITWLETFDAQLDLAAQGIVFKGYQFLDPKVTLNLSDGVLHIDPLTGQLFDGAVSLRAVVQQKSPVRLALGLSLSNANLYKALGRTAGIDRVTGRFGLTAQIQAIGNSERELISSLAGNATVAARDGTVKGINLRQLSDRLGKINNIVDFTGVVAGAFAGGQTRLISYDSNFAITGGALKTEDGRLVLDGGTGTTIGIINLARWQMFMRVRMRLSDHPEAPEFGLNYEGPLDAPRRDIRASELQAYVAQRLGSSVLRQGADTAGGLLGGTLGAITGGVLGGSSEQASPPQQQQTQPQQTQPQQPTTEKKRRKRDPAETILKGLDSILGN